MYAREKRFGKDLGSEAFYVSILEALSNLLFATPFSGRGGQLAFQTAVERSKL